MKPKRRTRLLRVADDLQVKAAAVARYADTTTPDMLDPLIRPFIEARFDTLPPAMRRQAMDRLKSTKAST